MRRNTLILILVVAMCGLTAFAQAKKEKKEAKAAPNAGVAQLYSLVGHWKGTAEMTEPGKSPVKVEATFRCSKASGGWAVLCHGRFFSKEMDYRETDLFGYDAEAGKVHWYAVTNAGEVHDHVGTWDGTTLNARYASQVGGKEMNESLALGIKGGNEMTFHGVTKVGGATASTVTGTIQKMTRENQPTRENQ